MAIQLGDEVVLMTPRSISRDMPCNFIANGVLTDFNDETFSLIIKRSLHYK
jgi:hypothetical protein